MSCTHQSAQFPSTYNIRQFQQRISTQIHNNFSFDNAFSDWLIEWWAKGSKINWTAQEWKHWQRWKFRLRSCVLRQCVECKVSTVVSYEPDASVSGKGCQPYERCHNTHDRNLKKEWTIRPRRTYNGGSAQILAQKVKTCCDPATRIHLPLTKTILYTWLMLQTMLQYFVESDLFQQLWCWWDLLHALSGTSALSIP